MSHERIEHLLSMAADAIERARDQEGNEQYARIQIAKAIDWLTVATAELGLRKEVEQ